MHARWVARGVGVALCAALASTLAADATATTLRVEYGVASGRELIAAVIVSDAPPGARAVLQSRDDGTSQVRSAEAVKRRRAYLTWLVPTASKTVSVRVAVLDRRRRTVAIAPWRTVNVTGAARRAEATAPLEVSLYLGLATAIATFAASAVALGLLHCARPRDRVLAAGVLLCATLGVATALATIARARATGAGNVLIGVGLVTAAVSVLSRALHQIFTVRDANAAAHSFASTSSSTLMGRVSLVRPSDGEPPGNDRPAFAGLPGAAVLRRQLWLTSATFVGVAVLAAAIALPGLLPDVLRDRPVGRSATLTPPAASGPATSSQRSMIVRVLNQYAEAVSTQDLDGVCETLSPDVLRISAGSQQCATGRQAVLDFHRREAFDTPRSLRLLGLSAADVSLLGRGRARAATRLSVNNGPPIPFSYSLRRVGVSWKINEIQGGDCR